LKLFLPFFILAVRWADAQNVIGATTGFPNAIRMRF
jgi:hypothetical protein